MKDLVAVVVSRMDKPLGRVVDSMAPFVEDLIIVRGKDGVVERWDRALTAGHDGTRNQDALVYVQDDDAVVDVEAFLRVAAMDACLGKVVCNMPADRRAEYPDGIALVGWGALMSKRAIDKAFRRYWTFATVKGLQAIWNDSVLRSEADRIMTGLSDLALVDVPFEHLEHAHGNDRMGRRANHGEMLKEARRRIYAIRANSPAPGLEVQGA